jgi:Mg-chelatase subunit ChlD
VPTVTPDPTPGGSPAPAYIPLCVRRHPVAACDLDVALVVDTSESMREITGGGRTKLDAAQDALGAFVSVLNLPDDHVAVVTFDDSSELVQGLTGDVGALNAAIRSFDTRVGSRLDMGICEARMELGGLRSRPDAASAIIVLTDGRVQPSSPAAAIEAAERARQEGIVLFAIGVGDEVSVHTLQRVASQPDYVHFAPDAEDLVDIYREIAFRLPGCMSRR